MLKSGDDICLLRKHSKCSVKLSFGFSKMPLVSMHFEVSRDLLIIINMKNLPLDE